MTLHAKAKRDLLDVAAKAAQLLDVYGVAPPQRGTSSALCSTEGRGWSVLGTASAPRAEYQSAKAPDAEGVTPFCTPNPSGVSVQQGEAEGFGATIPGSRGRK